MTRLYFVLGVAICLSANASTCFANAAVTNSIHEFMTTLYSNDMAGYRNAILPCRGSDVLVAKQTLTEEELTKVRSDVAALRLMQTDPYRHLGRDVSPDAKGEYPVGTKATFMTQFRWVNLAIPVAKTAEGWKVDVRYWLAMQREHKERDPEVVAKKFLFFLIGHQKKELSKVTTSGSNLEELLKGEAPFEDQYYALAMEMPVVQAHKDEAMLLSGGTILKAGTSSRRHKWFVGMYGPHQLVFELVKEKKGWRVVPRDYLSVIGIGAHPATAITEQPKDQKRMGL